MATPKQRRERRRAILPGFPVETPFQSKEEVELYLSGDRIVCLLCGKRYGNVGSHLRIHGITPDEYREAYRIPWSYGLCSGMTAERYSKAVRKRMAAGWDPPAATGDDLVKFLSAPKRGRAFESPENLGEAIMPKHPMEIGPDGEPETYSSHKRRLQAKKGTPEYKEKMRMRVSEASKEALRVWWKGKKQSLEHLRKRMKKIHGEDWEPKQENR